MNPARQFRNIRIFKNGRNQAIRIPRELELSCSEARIYKEGNRLVIEPLDQPTLLDLLRTWKPLDVEFPDIADQRPEPVHL